MTPVSGKSFDPVADGYDASRSLPEPLMAKTVTALATVLDAGTPVLEVGVGTGRFALALRDRGVRVIGVDIAERMLGKAREKGGEDLVLGTATALPFRNRAFRSSLAIHVLHLIADWRRVLSEVSRVTTDRFVTLLEVITTRALDADETPPPGHGPGDVYHPIRRYEALAARWGYRYEHPGVRPPQMIARMPPDIRVPVGRHSEVVPGETLLAPAASRSYSSQWAVPDDVHAKVMDLLTREMVGHDFERTWEIEVIAWPPDALRGM